MEKRRLQIISFFILFFAFLFSITIIAIAGVHFRYTSTTWTKHSWGALGATELASMIYVWFILALGTATFATLDLSCLIVFTCFDFLSICFTFGIIIFCFYGAKVATWDERLGCNAKYDGLWKAWKSVDIYLQAADSMLCSSRCPCYFNSTTTSLFASDSTTMPYISQWVKSDNRHDSHIRLQECPPDAVADVYNKYLMRNAYYSDTFRPDWFHIYYRHVEEFFKCTGFCGTTYYDESKRTSQKIVKYLFSDLTRGIPEHNGCLPRLLDWLTKTLNAFAGVGCIIEIFQIILFFMAMYFYCITSPSWIEERSQEKLSKQLVEKSSRQRNLRRKSDIKNMKNKAKKRVSLRKKEKDFLDKTQKKDSIKPEPQMIELGNINSSFVPNESQQNEAEFKFKPSSLN